MCPFNWFTGLALFLAAPSFANTVVLRAASANAKDYQAFVLSSSSYEFPSQVILRSLPSEADRTHLAALFAKAQSSFTEGSLSQAKQDFENVAGFAETDQWSNEEQNVLLHSFFRLAQLSNSPTKATEWLKKALAWTPNGQLIESFFPPPLVQQFKNMKADAPTHKVDLSAFSDDFNFLIINGQIIDLAKTKQLKLREGPLRATFVSNTFQPVTLQLASDQLAATHPDKKPWVEGSCLKPLLHWQSPGLLAKPFFGPSCAPMKSPKPNEFQMSYHPEIAPATRVETTPSLPLADDVSTSRAPNPFYKRTWFWVGIGAVVTTAVVVGLANSHSGGHPTTQEGF